MFRKLLRATNPVFFLTDPLDPDAPPSGGAGGGGGQPEPNRYATCDFCKCRLTRRGEIVSMSDEARVYRDLSERHVTMKKELEGQVDTLRAERDDARAKLAAAAPAPGPTGEPKKKNPYLPI